jgi:hypothetical protein
MPKRGKRGGARRRPTNVESKRQKAEAGLVTVRREEGARSGKSAARRKGSGPVTGMEAAGCARRSGLGSPLVATGDPATRLARAEQQEAAWPALERSPSCLAPVAGCYAPTAPGTRRRTWGSPEAQVRRVAAAQATSRDLADESAAVSRILSTE